MNDKEKVELGIKACWSEYFSHKCFDCPYMPDRNDKKCVERLGADAIALLKEHEEREKAICKEICDFIRGSCSTDTDADKDYVCHEIQKMFIRS